MSERIGGKILLFLAATVLVSGSASHAQFNERAVQTPYPARGDITHADSPRTGGPLSDQMARAQAQAATDDAFGKLRDVILHENLTLDLTVADLVVATHSSDQLTRLIKNAQIVGGQRWLDGGTCQIQLQLSGAEVSAALERMASENAADSPIRAVEIHRNIADWHRRSFVSVGSSTATPALGLHHQDIPQAWRTIPDDVRDRAIAAARQDAVNHILDDIGPIDLDSRQTVADALAVPAVKKSLASYLAARPVTRLRLRDDMQAEVTLAVTSGELVDALCQATVDQKGIQLPPPVELTRLRDRFARALVSTSGSAAAGGPAAARAQVVRLPRRAPQWAVDQLDAESTVRSRAPRLIAARDAEAEAIAKLRSRLETLPLDAELTLGAAAARDEQIRVAIDRAMVVTRIGRTSYNADGSVTVHVYVDLALVWAELHR